MIDQSKQDEHQKNIEKWSQPASSNYGALQNLFNLGKTTVTTSELKKAGFNTGFFGPIGPDGCEIKEFKLHRSDPFSETFTLSKIR